MAPPAKLEGGYRRVDDGAGGTRPMTALERAQADREAYAREVEQLREELSTLSGDMLKSPEVPDVPAVQPRPSTVTKAAQSPTVQWSAIVLAAMTGIGSIVTQLNDGTAGEVRALRSEVEVLVDRLRWSEEHDRRDREDVAEIKTGMRTMRSRVAAAEERLDSYERRHD